MDGDYCCNLKGQKILCFSKQFKNKIRSINEAGYVPCGAKVKFIVYWQREDSDYKIRIVLPEIYFKSFKF